MSYPNFKNKHLEESLINPQDYINYKSTFKEFQKKGIKKYVVIYYPTILGYFKRKYHPKINKLNRHITVYQHKDVGIVCMKGIGSPQAVTVFEELIGLGGKKFINIGSAGGLIDFGIFLCNRAIRDEGTSQHYSAHDKYAYPDKKLTNELGRAIEMAGLNFTLGTTWTIDAPYRETIKEANHYKKEGVKTVEMETSALFSVAKYRKVKIASAFAVSDILGEKKWDPQFDARHVRIKLNKLFDAALDCLK